ncbi:MAG TPA: c-type cytochrome [Pyrinomonadaceae bacterium]|nr:c-type cytochrome [Pyrinomonadaceae bacterium]
MTATPRGTWLVPVLFLLASSLFAQTAPAAPPRLAEEQFKNIQILKGIPADQVIPGMQFIANSLAVECDYCHVQGSFDKDDKKPKQTARAMMQMMAAINKNNFDGKRAVTCNSCHHGSPKPDPIPAIPSEAPAKPADASKAPAPPSPDALVDNFVKAAGGAPAIEKVSTRVMKGSSTVNGHSVPIEILAKDNKRLSIMHASGGDSLTAFDGHAGWLGNPGRPARDMSATESEAAQFDADLHFPLHIKTIFHELQPGPAITIADRKAYQVVGVREGKPPVRLFFDAESGLLVRMLRYADTPFGDNPTQLDYADYRDLGGVKMPYRWTIARPLGRFTIQLDDAQQNVPVDDAKFQRPPDPPPPAH